MVLILSRATAGLLLLAVACTAQDGRAKVSTSLQERTGRELPPRRAPAKQPQPQLPPGVDLAQPLTARDAVAVALWNNAALEAALAQLGVAKADLIEAGLLRNPSFQALLPVGLKPFESLLQAPIEGLWQRPRRKAAAAKAYDQVAAQLVQAGLDLARDVTLAHVELALAERRAAVTTEAAALRQRIAEMTGLRLKAGDVSEFEALQARVDAASHAEAAARAGRETAVARERLRGLMGLRGGEQELHAAAERTVESLPDWRALVERALAARPDLRAAEIGIEAAAEKARWERRRLFQVVTPILSVKEIGTPNGLENRAGPGFQLELPVFNRNQGGIARADAEVERAAFEYVRLRDAVEVELRAGREQWLAARESRERIGGALLQGAEESVRLAERAWKNGDVPYLAVLEATRLLLDVRLRQAEAEAGLRRAQAAVEHGIGSRL